MMRMTDCLKFFRHLVRGGLPVEQNLFSGKAEIGWIYRFCSDPGSKSTQKMGYNRMK